MENQVKITERRGEAEADEGPEQGDRAPDPEGFGRGEEGGPRAELHPLPCCPGEGGRAAQRRERGRRKVVRVGPVLEAPLHLGLVVAGRRHAEQQLLAGLQPVGPRLQHSPQINFQKSFFNYMV